MGTCIQQGDLFYSAGLHKNKKAGRGVGKNAGEWTRRLEISKEEIHGSKRGMYGYVLQALKGERLSSVLTRWDYNFCIHSSPLLAA